MTDIAASIGLDWADERHSVQLQPTNGKIDHHELEQKPAVLHEWVAQLQRRFAGGKIAIALEQRKGAVIHARLMYDCFVLYPINPKALARYREAFTTSGAKDDPLDSELLLDLVVRHRDKLRAWVPDTVESRTLQALCEQRRKLVNQRVALTNRLTSLLKQYFPQLLELCPRRLPLLLELLGRWPTLAVLQRVHPGTLRAFLLGTARNLVLKRWRDEHPHDSIDEDSSFCGPVDVLGQERAETVRRAVQMLPPLQREAIILAEYEELTLEEIALVTESAV